MNRSRPTRNGGSQGVAIAALAARAQLGVQVGSSAQRGCSEAESLETGQHVRTISCCDRSTTSRGRRVFRNLRLSKGGNFITAAEPIDTVRPEVGCPTESDHGRGL